MPNTTSTAFVFCASFALIIGAAAAAQQADTIGEAPVYIDAVSTEGERTQLASLINEAHSVLRSQAFRDNLTALKSTYPHIYANAAWPDVDAERLAGIVSVAEPNTRYIRLPVHLRGSEAYDDGNTGFNYMGVTGSTHFNGTDPVGTMSLGRVNMYRYRQENIVDRSCAINTWRMRWHTRSQGRRDNMCSPLPTPPSVAFRRTPQLSPATSSAPWPNARGFSSSSV